MRIAHPAVQQQQRQRQQRRQRQRRKIPQRCLLCPKGSGGPNKVHCDGRNSDQSSVRGPGHMLQGRSAQDFTTETDWRWLALVGVVWSRSPAFCT